MCLFNKSHIPSLPQNNPYLLHKNFLLEAKPEGSFIVLGKYPQIMNLHISAIFVHIRSRKHRFNQSTRPTNLDIF
jgi:hypothetical protein